MAERLCGVQRVFIDRGFPGGQRVRIVRGMCKIFAAMHAQVDHMGHTKTLVREPDKERDEKVTGNHQTLSRKKIQCRRQSDNR